jgi:outer membrane protein assembly factor BamB
MLVGSKYGNPPVSYAFGIDFGTSRSAGAIADERGVSPLEIEGNRWMPSMVFLDESGTLLVGTAADNLAGVQPDRLERTPKRLIGSPAPLLLGGQSVDVVDAVAAVLKAVAAEAKLRNGGDAPHATVLTHPVRWEEGRKSVLEQSADAAELAHVTLLPEPVAAAIHYASTELAVGEHVAVYDLGGGTFDTAVLVRTDDGFEVVGEPGGDEAIGGEHFDHALFRYFGECIADDNPELWDEMLTSDERKWKRAALDLLAQARRAKEALSSYTTTQVFVPVADRDIVVNRSQFEAMIIEEIERTIDIMDDTIADAGLQPEQLRAIYLVGGSSRLPVVTQLMTERFGDRVTTRDEPKGVVALGASRAALARISGNGVGVDVDPTAPNATEAPLPDVAPETDAAASPTATVDVVWHKQLDRAAGQLAHQGDIVTCGSDDGTLYVMAALDGEMLSHPDLGAVVYAAPVVHGEAVLTAALDGVVRRVDARTGAIEWQVDTGAACASDPVLANDTLFVANDAGMLHALDPATGSTRWQLPCGRPVRAGLATAATPTATLVIVCGTDGVIYAADITSGHVHWMYRAQGGLTGTPAALAGTVVVPCADGILYALDTSTGQPRYGYRAHNALTTPATANNTTAYCIDGDGVLHAIEPGSGALRWKYTVGTSAYSSGPSADDHIVALDNGTGSLLVLDAATGAERLRVATGENNRARALVAPGHVYISTTFAQVYCIASG